MLWTKIKKTLTISSNLKKIDTTSISTSGKKSFSVEKKKPFRQNKFTKPPTSPNINFNPESKKKLCKKIHRTTGYKRFY